MIGTLLKRESLKAGSNTIPAVCVLPTPATTRDHCCKESGSSVITGRVMAFFSSTSSQIGNPSTISFVFGTPGTRAFNRTGNPKPIAVLIHNRSGNS